MSYASPSDLLLRFDNNLLGMLVNDNSVQQTPTQLLTNAPLQAALDDASGAIESALYTAYKYTANDLQNLTHNSASLLKRITCDIAIVYLCQRRGYDYKDKFPMSETSFEILQKLRYGERVLDFADNEQAGLSATDYISTVQLEHDGFVTTNANYFPSCGCGYGLTY
jgi:phage gp36-like protein